VSIFDQITSWFGKAPDDPPPSEERFAGGMIPMRQPPEVGDKQRLEAFHRVAALHMVQHAVSQAVASNRWHISKGDETTTDHPAWNLWRRPNDQLSGYQYRYLQSTYADLLGETFAEVVDSDDSDRPFHLRPLPPTAMTLEEQRGQWMWRVRLGDRDERVSPDRIIWSVASPDLANPYGRGKGLAHVVGDDLEIDEFAAEFTRAFFHNDARPSLLWTKGDGGRGQGWDTKDRKRLRKTLDQNHRGSRKSHRNAFLSGDIDVQEISTQFNHLNITDLRSWEQDLVRKVYGIPPEIIGQTTDSNRATSRAAESIMAKQAVKPRLRRMEEDWERHVLSRFDDSGDLSIAFENPVPEDKETKKELIAEKPEAFTVNEIRQTAGFAEVEGGDIFLRPPAAKEREVEAGEPLSEQQVKALPDMTDEAELVEGEDDIIQFPVAIHTRQPGDLPDDLTPEQVSEALQPEQIEAGLVGAYEAEAAAWAARGAQNVGVNVDDAILNPLVRDHVEEFGGERVVGIAQTQKDEINRIVDRGIKAGANPLDITNDIDEMYLDDIIPNRSETIARTEMGRASNWGTYTGQKASGVVERREWIGSIDNRIRRAHKGLNGLVVDMDESFEIPAGNPNAGATAKFPHGFGIAGQDINCRCTTGAVMPERHAGPEHFKTEDGYFLEASRETIWKVYDSDLRQSERRFEEVVRETMREVRTTVLRRAGRVLGVDVSDRIRTDDEEVA